MSGPALRSPLTGRRLERDTAHSLSDGAHRWPVIDDIPFLRAGRKDLAREAVLCLDRGDAVGALALLLADGGFKRSSPSIDRSGTARIGSRCETKVIQLLTARVRTASLMDDDRSSVGTGEGGKPWISEAG